MLSLVTNVVNVELIRNFIRLTSREVCEVGAWAVHMQGFVGGLGTFGIKASTSLRRFSGAAAHVLVGGSRFVRGF